MANKKYVNVHIDVIEEDFEIAYSILTELNFIGMEEKLDEIILSFEEKDWNNSVKQTLEQNFNELLPNAKISNIQTLTEKNWNEEWERNVQPVQVSENLVITPEWKKDLFACKYKIIINPKMSFGTGQHSTTLLMSKMIENYFIQFPKSSPICIDAGTGTGVLAIIAAKLGAQKVFAFDNDEWAYENAIENVEFNNVADLVEVSQSNVYDYDFKKADVIFANMFLTLVKSSFSNFYKALVDSKGLLFVSGILLYDHNELLESATNNGFELIEETQDQEWCCFKFKVSEI